MLTLGPRPYASYSLSLRSGLWSVPFARPRNIQYTDTVLRRAAGPKQESPPPHGGDPAATASHAPVTSPSSYTSSPGSSPSGTPSTKSLPEETPPPAPEPRERRKRSRVSPEQLIVLEAIFAADRCPTAVRRKEISEQLGMNERQTQIWFQNRCAFALCPRVVCSPLTASTPVHMQESQSKASGQRKGSI